MKAAFLLICLALVQSSTANIFQRSRTSLVEQPQDYISQIQNAQQDQRQDDEEQRQQYKQKNQRQQYSQKDQGSKYMQRDQKVKYDQRAQRPYNSYERKSLKHRTQSQESFETKETSQETKPINQNQMYLNQFNKKQNTNKLQEQVQPQYGDAISWNELQMAVDPDSPITEEDIEKIYGDAQSAMKHVPAAEKPQFHELYKAAAEKDNEDTHLNATELLKKYNYPVEEHTVMTDDGYILTLFRIPPKMKPREIQPRKVVFLMHGISGSADDWLLMGPGQSLAYLLSDEGYDVWLGNARGNRYSSEHVSKHPAVNGFWEFSNDEVALHDLPAMIDYILEQTHQQKLHYIGHSQGTTTFFALAATRPEYNDKIIMMYALSPMVYMSHVRSPLLRMISPTSKFSKHFREQLGDGEFNPKSELLQNLGGAMCEKEIDCKNVCSNVNFVMSGVNVEGLNADLIPVILGHLPAGTSTRIIKQYAQAVASHEFRQYDYGSVINEQVYDTPQPPKYQMENVKAPVSLFYSEEDWLAHPTDVQRLQKELPNVQESYQVPDEHFSHLDFQFSTKAPSLVYQHLIDSMEKQNETY